MFAIGALVMAWDFIVKLRPLYPQAIDRLISLGGEFWAVHPIILAAPIRAAGRCTDRLKIG
ncbi:MAG TPA: hypothetical protein VME45_04230 [Stellaceae bacterium]|nr:hypothetical protein [Stellaceae bacterium]